MSKSTLSLEDADAYLTIAQELVWQILMPSIEFPNARIRVGQFLDSEGTRFDMFKHYMITDRVLVPWYFHRDAAAPTDVAVGSGMLLSSGFIAPTER